MKEQRTPPPSRKKPGLLSRPFAWFFGMLLWLVISLLVSIVIEWVGIALFWNEEGSRHSKILLERDYAYLNQRVIDGVGVVGQSIRHKTVSINRWVAEESGFKRAIVWMSQPVDDEALMIRGWFNYLYTEYKEYLLSIPHTVQIFFIRLALILFSLPVFLLFGGLGMIDGLVERELRRWGGGRESSLVYNLARRSVFPAFISACVIYLSFPISVHPAWVIMPFALFFGLSMRVTFERLKKHF